MSINDGGRGAVMQNVVLSPVLDNTKKKSHRAYYSYRP